jgi:hypothetical protein
LKRLCIGTLGLAPHYSPSQMMRILNRAAKWLIECGYLREIWYSGERCGLKVYFRRQGSSCLEPTTARKLRDTQRTANGRIEQQEMVMDTLLLWIESQYEEDLARWEAAALETGFGSDLERKIVIEEECKGIPVKQARRIRQEYVRRYVESGSTCEGELVVSPAK